MGAVPAFVRELIGSAKPPRLFTLAIIERNGKVLLGLKKKGFGQGYYNGFGGKVEPGETIVQAAEREVRQPHKQAVGDVCAFPAQQDTEGSGLCCDFWGVALMSGQLTEEAGIHATSLHHRGILTFAFDDQPQPWEVHVFHVPNYTGEPTESDEMLPVCMNQSEIPYDKMWADDIHWYPIFLKGASFQGIFAFRETHKLVWHKLKEVQRLGFPAQEFLD